jgi:hypothetical protein
MATAAPLSGAEFVLVAQVPKAGRRWHQVHFNRDVAARFFRLDPGEERKAAIEGVDANGQVVSHDERPLVFSQINRNIRIEFDFAVQDYPKGGIPILLVLELDIRRFRYLLLCPGDPGYAEVSRLNASLPTVGHGHRRVITNLDEVELRWPGCPLRAAS